MLKHGEINPLNVHDLRRLDWCPPHFERIILDQMSDPKVLTDWIYENLEGRFYLGPIDVKVSDHTDLRSDKKYFNRQTLIAFELASEGSYFSLCLPNITA